MDWMELPTVSYPANLVFSGILLVEEFLPFMFPAVD
jgi:hypothetical protein